MNPSDRMSDDKPAVMALIPLALTIAAMFLALDVFDLWAGARYPQLLGEVACRIWPYVWFARISVSSQAGYYVERACVGSPVDPLTASIIFFVAKNAIAGLGVPLAWITVFTTSGLANRLKEDCFRSIESYKSYRAALVWMSIGAALSVLYPIIGVWLCGYPSTVEQFGTSLVHKLVEDHFAFFVVGVGWGVTELLLWFALYPLQREISRPVDRRKRRNETVP